ncbi:hypothetical protein [Nocardioides sp. W7]|uniref:hypothetical protein n=1 Tax=Nocardioides sp. W7 TaxID=2931390 RepID=UPI001FD3CC07|nr:hypothetical protein [Nocardioides sp. W7]
MNDLDQFADRLRALGQRAPVPIADPLLDIRRGRVALRRRHARSAAGVTTALVAAGAVATTFPGLHLPGGGGSTAIAPAGSPSGATSPTTSPLPTAKDPCTIEAPADGDTTVLPGAIQRGEGIGASKSEPGDVLTIENDPQVAAALPAYREAAAAILDPSGEHLDRADRKRSNNVQASSYCDPKTGEHLTRLGTKIGWTGGGALGVIQIEVVTPAHDDEPQTVLNHAGWTAYQGQLPTGVSAAEVASYSNDGGGHAVAVERADGLTVTIDAAATWGNNVAPGSAPATDLPGIDKLVELAASPELTFPER